MISRFLDSYPNYLRLPYYAANRNGEQASPTAIGSSSPHGIPSDITLAEEPEPVGVEGVQAIPACGLMLYSKGEASL